MLDEGLRNIIEGKGINNFWELLEYLNTTGYEYIDSLGIALNFFTESQIFQDVAFIRLKTFQKEESYYVGGIDPVYPPDAHDWYAGNDHGITINQSTRIKEYSVFIVGIITDENKHMRGIYEHYMKAIAYNKLEYNDHQIEEIERTCKTIYEFSQLPSLVLGYLGDVADRHYGFQPIHKKINKSFLVNELTDEAHNRIAQINRLR